ncbi:Cyclic-di-GMP-binding biofilm dispersal mediator protein [Nocardioides aquaticus]|uniref:Cyclic-di-GMP-binding biofilm dispersal mediator protein n=1 Tax=Nocardioides aquaticus TaxID=160826 RepID=A0ABX8ENZ3_9ACTN|nr:SDR family oxidoreductase [Nocardioides aquaticus]QVT81892.1 Cyclic-di-GMP-binding biofilm dispersal mediator protein [Nocardioides aquaticus]
MADRDGMQIDGARVLVAGATGVIGGKLVDALVERGARVVPAGRDEERLAALGERTGTTPQVLDAVDADSVRRAVDAAVAELGGLDLLVVTVGAAGFGKAVDLDAAVTEELFAVNVQAPMALVRAAAPALTESEHGTAVVLSAILADLPTVGMADYSAAKSALSTWLGVLRKEQRRAFRVVDVRPPHLDTGLDQRALAGEPPRLPEPVASDEVVTAILDALAGDQGELVWEAKEKKLTPR